MVINFRATIPFKLRWKRKVLYLEKNNLATTIACIQMEPRFGQVKSNLESSLKWIEKASRKGADIVVLPELCTTGYVFKNRAELFSLSEVIPYGPSIEAWSEVSKKNNLYVVAGIAEKDKENLYNSAVIIGPEGYIGTYRKNHLSNEEKRYFELGNLGFQVFQTDIGRVGILICYDIWFPEAVRINALQGSDLICVPTNWSDIKNQRSSESAMAVHLTMANAHCNGIFIACANRVGEEKGVLFNGQSIIVDNHGWPITPPASKEKEEMILATCHLLKARNKNFSEHNLIMEDRRTDLY